MSSLKLFLDADGELGYNPLKLTKPLTSVKYFRYTDWNFHDRRDGNSDSTKNDVLCPEGLEPRYHAYKIVFEIKPPVSVIGFYVQGRVKSLEVHSVGNRPDQVYHSNHSRRLSNLLQDYPTKTFVSLRSKGSCSGFTFHSLPLIDFNLPDDVANFIVQPVFLGMEAPVPTPRITACGSLLYGCEKTKDVTIVTADDTLRAHKCVLIAGSEYFQTHFDFRDDAQINMDETFDLVQEVVKFIYLRTLEVENFTMLLGLIEAASKYQVVDLSEVAVHKVEGIIRSNAAHSINDVIPALQTAKRFNLPTLLVECNRYISDHAYNLIVNSQWVLQYAAVIAEDPPTDHYESD